MKRDRAGRWTLEHPHDLYEFTHRGMHFQRLTALHELGKYRVRCRKSGRCYVVTGGNSKRFPWRAVSTIETTDGFRAGVYSNLIAAAEGLARFDGVMYAVAWKPTPAPEHKP